MKTAKSPSARNGSRFHWWLVRRTKSWGYLTPRNGLRARLHALLVQRHRWWDWGHRVMILTGSDYGGNWQEPEPPTWWYRENGTRRMWRTGYPRRRFQIVTDYDEYRKFTEGLNEDEMYRWNALAFDQDGQLILGHRYWGGAFYGLPRDELSLLRRYLRMARRHDWFGARSWLYSQALHAAVHQVKPRTCAAVPPKGQGGYDHWHCQLPKRHKDMHRFRNYVWGDVGGEPIAATFDPKG